MPPNIATTQPNRVNLAGDWNFTGDLTLNGSAVITQNSPGNGTVTNVSVSSVSGIVSSVDTPTATPIIHLSLGAITPTSVLSNGTLGGSNFSGSSSGTNTGDQTITLTGDITGTGMGSFATTIGAGKVTEAMQVLADNTTNNVSTSKHGYVPKAPNDTDLFLRGDASWSAMPLPPSTIPVENEATDTSCFPLFVTAATGDLGAKTNTNLSFNSSTGVATFSQTINGSISGNAATVTTNANLTGPITSAGNATSVASQTGTGSTFVMDTSPTLVTPVLGVATATSIAIGGGSAISAVAAGVYTPTRSGEVNLDGDVTMSEAQYMRVGNTCTVSGRFTADPTLTATTTSFEITLPVASNLGAAEDVAGVAFCGTIAGQGAAIIGVANNDTAKIQWVSTDVTSQPFSYTFTYTII